MRSLGVYDVLAIDVNALTSSDDVKPSRFEVLREAVAVAARKLLERGGWVALLAFYRRPVPLLYFTRDYSLVESALNSLSIAERGVALSEAVREACYLLLSAPPGYATRTLVFTSGGFRLGPPPEPIAFFARSIGVVIDFLTVSRADLIAADVEWISRFVSWTGGVWEHARSREEALAKAVLLASREVGARPGRVWRPGLGVYPPRQLYTRQWSLGEGLQS